MKRFLSLALALTVAMCVQAQNLPDGSFENWTSYEAEAGQYWDYSTDVLRTLNSLYEIPPDPFTCELTAFRDTNAYDGDYAISLTSRWFGVNAIFVPGALATLSEDFVSEYLDNPEHTINTKQQHTFKPWRVTGYYKYEPVNGDSAVIALDFYRNNTKLSTCEPYKIREAHSEWTPFEIVTGLETQAMGVTHVSMIFASSAAYDFAALEECKGQENSTLYLDKLEFLYESGLVEPLMPVVKTSVYPNPSSEVVRFDFNKDVNARLVIYNINGAEIGTMNVGGSYVDYNVTSMSNGTYLYRVIEDNTILSSGKFVVSK